MFKSAKKSFKSIVLKVNSFSISNCCAQICSTPEMDLDVLVFGSSNIDYLTYVTEIPKPGETLMALHREQCFGGKGANQCVAAAKLGGKCALISKLGSDDLGEKYLEYLKTLEIDVENVEQVENTQTGLAEIIVADNADNTIIVLCGANSMLKAKDVTRFKKKFKRAKVLLCQLETEAKAVLCALKSFKGVSILNASPIPKENFNTDLIKAPTILCVNEVEAAQLTNRKEVKTLKDAKAAANDLIARGAKSVIITMGEQGAVHLSSKRRDFCTHCPAAPVRYVADTSGAGDAFLGSLAYHIATFPNLTRESHIGAANMCAAYSVGRRGTQPSFPNSECVQNELCRSAPAYTIIMDEPEVPPEEIPKTAPVIAPLEAVSAETQTTPEDQQPQETEPKAKEELESEEKLKENLEEKPEEKPEEKLEKKQEEKQEEKPEVKQEEKQEEKLEKKQEEKREDKPELQKQKTEPEPVPALTT